MRLAAAVTAAAAPPAPAMRRASFVLLRGNVRCGLFRCEVFGLLDLVCGLAGDILELVFFLERHDRGFGLFGAGFGGLDGVNLITAIDDERLRRHQRRIGADGDRDREPLLQRPQMRALLVENVKRDIRRVRAIRLCVAPFISCSSRARNTCNASDDTERTWPLPPQ